MSDSSAQHEPRWPVVLALMSVGGLYWALPESLTPGPGWLLLALVAPLSVAATILQKQARYNMNRIVGHALSGLVTTAVVASLVLLIAALPDRKEAPRELLRSAAALWISNIL